eukprot:Partr_v1_DN25257_c3_g1_i1_m16769 putative Alport syndrome, mental retardation, midface hypoplasia and elliptocytosis chromosomal region gene 1
MNDHCFICWSALDGHLNGSRHVLPPVSDKRYPLFVTWKTRGGGQLRGCIGSFTPQPLRSGLEEYALAAALRDSRFPPVERHELPQLTCSVSLLIQFESTGIYEWEIGKHGVRIEFKNPRTSKPHSSTYLPSVAKEQKWDQSQTIESLLRKSGYHGDIDDDLLSIVKVVRYQAVVTSMDHLQFQEVVTRRPLDKLAL